MLTAICRFFFIFEHHRSLTIHSWHHNSKATLQVYLMSNTLARFDLTIKSDGLFTRVVHSRFSDCSYESCMSSLIYHTAFAYYLVRRL